MRAQVQESKQVHAAAGGASNTESNHRHSMAPSDSQRTFLDGTCKAADGALHVQRTPAEQFGFEAWLVWPVPNEFKRKLFGDDGSTHHQLASGGATSERHAAIKSWPGAVLRSNTRSRARSMSSKKMLDFWWTGATPAGDQNLDSRWWETALGNIHWEQRRNVMSNVGSRNLFERATRLEV